MGAFSNEFDAKLLVGLAVFAAMAAPVFGIFYNRWMNQLGEHEHTSYYVAGGVFFTLFLGALISWKSFLLFFVLFALDGLPMVIGEVRRTEKRVRQPRRKRLPYAANGLIDEAKMSAEQMTHHMKDFLESGDAKKINQMQAELTIIVLRLVELKTIQEK